MKVFTYWEDLNDGQPRPTHLIDLWAYSWHLRGWEPVVLGRAEAERSPFYAKMVAAANRLPTVNDPAYEQANYVRYAALESVGGGWMLDYDCINYSFFSDCVAYKMKEWPVISLDAGAFWMPLDYLRQHMGRICAWPANDAELVGGKPHISDMTLLRKLVPRCYTDLTAAVVYKDFHWRTAQVVHYSNEMTRGWEYDKPTLIKKERPV